MTTGEATRGHDSRSTTLPVLSLRGKLLLFAAGLILVPGFLFGLLAQQSGRASLERVIGRQLAREAGHTADRFTALLESERQALQSFAHQHLMRDIRVADIDKRISSALGTLREGSTVRLDYLVADRTGRIVASSNPGLIGPLPPWADVVDPVLNGDDRFRGPAPIATYGDAVIIATPVPDPDGGDTVIGALLGLYDWRSLTAVLERVRDDLALLGLATEVFVVGSDGAVVGNRSSSTLPEAWRSIDWLRIIEADAEDQPSYNVDPDNGLLVGGAALASAPPGWRLLIVEPLSDALAPARRLTIRLAVTLSLTLAVALGFAALAAGRVARPLSELTEATRTISRGEASSLQVPVRTEDEVGTLATAFNRMATELDRAQRDLVEAAKFAFVGELAAGVAHEVRTSLGVLRSSAQILERSLPDAAEEESIELAQLIREEVDRLAGVVNDLLSLSRPRALHLEETAISVPVFRAADFVEPQAGQKGIEIRRRPSEDDPSVKCDAELIYQVTLNLLVNALQAVEGRGWIEVRTFATADGGAGFEVRDSGEGIPEDARSQIFLPFVTTREGGVGLGLTFVKRVIHEHGGRVSVESETGAGSCLRVELPAT